MKYRIIHRNGIYRAQTSRFGIFWQDIASSSYSEAYTFDDPWPYLRLEDAHNAIAAMKAVRQRSAEPWVKIPVL